MKHCLCLLIIFWLPCSFAQDVYQVLRDNTQGFAEVKKGVPLSFPKDHLPHPEYRIEWWYITANLRDQEGQDWGLQWTLFRQSLSPEPDTIGWDSNQLWMAHAAITTPEKHIFEQRFARGGIAQAGVDASKGFEAWIDDWSWQSSTNSPFPSILKFTAEEYEVKLELNSAADWVLNGDAGFSQKSAQGQASYYYSQPNISINGTIKSKQNSTSLSGNAWLDREWSSQALAQNQKGWDWFSLHLNDGSKLMVYQLRHDTGEHWISGSWIDSNGEVMPLGRDDIKLSAQSERQISTIGNTSISLPLDWSITLPTLYQNFNIKPLYDEQWLATSFPYWEGVVLVIDDNRQRIGHGFMELTGYQP